MVSDGIPWARVVERLDALDTRRASRTSYALEQALESAADGASTLAAELAPHISNLATVDGRKRGLDLLAGYAAVPEVRAMMFTALDTGQQETRLLAAEQLVAQLSLGHPEVRSKLVNLLGDDDEVVRDYAIRHLPALIGDTGALAATAQLRVLPDAERRTSATQLLEKLERAIHTLQDLGLDEAQDAIVVNVILPTIAEVQTLLSAEASDAVDAGARRRVAVKELGSLQGATQALVATNLAVTGIANADEAAANAGKAFEGVAVAADGVSAIGSWILEALQHVVV